MDRVASQLAEVRDSIAIAERDMVYISDWIREHPEDPHVPDYQRLLTLDEATLRRERKRNAALERRLARAERRSRAAGRAFFPRLRLRR